MRNEKRKVSSPIQYARAGIVLLVTLVLLVVLSSLMFTLSVRMSAQRHRDKYIMDYQSARYARDSAVKYALATLNDINTPRLIERPNEPDFSDLFMLDEEEYAELLAEWAVPNEDMLSDQSDRDLEEDFRSRSSSKINPNDVNGLGYIDDSNYVDSFGDSNSHNSLTVRGPYGPPWPCITEPVEFEVGSAKVRIEIEDESAKYPIGWAMMNDKKIEREVIAGLETFCEWMDVNDVQIDSLKDQLEQIRKIKPFKIDFKPITQIQRQTVPAPKTIGSTRRTSRSRVRAPRTRTVRKTISVAEQVAKQNADFAKLLHSSLIDTESLARPIIISETRKESALKYIGMWASRQVNINTAPRHVLEAAFIFGGDADKIAAEIIQRRRITPFADIDDLKQDLFRYSTSIEKCEKYITTASKMFTIKVTAASGVAKASAIIGIVKEGSKITRIAVISN
ncbi:MAG: general secretion pathway protein GspK [Planctomycetes bacterium]|nr:general secretion pathway protein GspK [Planctomycetota bacterium]